MFALYNVGDTHEVDGVKCAIARVPMGDLELMRAQGWVDRVEDIGKSPEVKAAKKSKEKKDN
jgi:hypothetical protein